MEFLDYGDKMASMLGLVAAVLFGVLGLRRSRTARRQIGSAAGQVGHLVKKFLDRDDESTKLRRYLRDDTTRFIIVLGAPGVGKTALVKRVLGKVRAVCRPRRVTPLTRLQGQVILGDIESAAGSAPRSSECDKSFQDRMTAAIEALGNKRVVIWIDAAERLLDEGGRFHDLSLDEAFEVLATSGEHRVKVVLTSTEPVFPRADGTWADPARLRELTVTGLPLPHFTEFLSIGDGAEHVAPLDEQALRQLHIDLHGRPRLAQLFRAIAGLRKGGANTLAVSVQTWAESGDSIDRIGERLQDELMASLGPADSVYRAVAALRTPVDAATVAELCNSLPASQHTTTTEFAARILGDLSGHVFYVTVDHRYFLPDAEARRAVEWRPHDAQPRSNQNRQLLVAAAELLRSQRRKADHRNRVHPDAATAEVEAWLRSGRPESAYASITDLDHGARQGTPDPLYRDAREQIKDSLDRPEAAANASVLGYLYQIDGDPTRARAQYRQALDLISDDAPMAAKVWLNLGWLSWSHGLVESARTDFEKAERTAPEDPAVVVGALDGIARCLRREGQFSAAVTTMIRALNRADSSSLRTIRLHVRIARINLDLGRISQAHQAIPHMIKVADRHRNDAAKAVCLDAQADVWLAEGRDQQALRSARKALQLALAAHDFFTVVQARSTICVVHMRAGRWPEAAKEAALAERYRNVEESLILIALGGIANRRAGFRELARSLFARLLEQAENRSRAFTMDFAARQLEGLARCAIHLDGGSPSTKDAEEAFAMAHRKFGEAAPGLTAFMTWLLTSLAADEAERDRLRRPLAIVAGGEVRH